MSFKNWTKIFDNADDVEPSHTDDSTCIQEAEYGICEVQRTADPAKVKSGIISQSLSSKLISITITLMYFLPTHVISCLVYLCTLGHV